MLPFGKHRFPHFYAGLFFYIEKIFPMHPLAAEFFGTALLLFLGNGVVANVILQKTKGHGSGWLVINFGWAMAVYVAVLVAGKYSGAHLNPAVTTALALKTGDWSNAATFIPAQLAGAMVGSFLVWVMHQQHFDATPDADAKLAVFCTAPAIRNPLLNLLSETAGTFVLVTAVLHISAPDAKIGSLDALPVALVVLAVGICLGGTTGYAINPARDLGPRIVHFLLPLKGKRDSDWAYSWIPVLGPIAGALLAVGVYRLLA
jgi:glycerol uptake facilitator protein